MVTPLPYGRQWIDDDDVAAVVAALRGEWLTQGPAVARFEEVLCAITGAKYAVAVSSGTAALHLAFLAAGMRTGDVGATSDITFVASANGMRYAGAEPRLVDVDPSTALATAATFAQVVAELEAQGRKPKVLVPVDFSGAVADLPAIQALATRSGALVVEDAAHSLGAAYTHEGREYNAGACVHSAMAILSFHPVKHLTTAEGGAITTNDEGLYRELLDLRTHGITKDPSRMKENDGPWYYEQRRLGFNYRITDVQCALGVSQARKFPTFLARRREIARRYDRAFATVPDRVVPLAVRPGTTSAYHLYVVMLKAKPGETLDALRQRRRGLFLRLREQQIYAQVHYIPVHRQPDFVDHGLTRGTFAGAERYYAACISLPMFPAMNDDDVDRVVDVVMRGAR